MQDVPRSRLSGARSNVPASQAGSPGSTRPGTPFRGASALPDSPEAAPADVADPGAAAAGELEVQGSSASLGLSSVASCAQDSCVLGQEFPDEMPPPSHLSQAVIGTASRPLSARSANAAGFHQGLGTFKVCFWQRAVWRCAVRGAYRDPCSATAAGVCPPGCKPGEACPRIQKCSRGCRVALRLPYVK